MADRLAAFELRMLGIAWEKFFHVSTDKALLQKTSRVGELTIYLGPYSANAVIKKRHFSFGKRMKGKGMRGDT